MEIEKRYKHPSENSDARDADDTNLADHSKSRLQLGSGALLFNTGSQPETSVMTNHPLSSLSAIEKSALIAKGAATSMKDSVLEAGLGLHRVELTENFGLTLPNALETVGISAAIGIASKTLLPNMGILGKLGNAALAFSLAVPVLKESCDAVKGFQSASTENDLRLASQRAGTVVGTLAATAPLGIAGFAAGANSANQIIFSSRLKEVSRKLGVQELVESHPQLGDINLFNQRELRKAPEIKQELLRNLDAISQANSYEPITRSFGAYTLPIHNKELANMMRPSYTISEFKSILDAHERRQFWDLPTDKNTGFVRTSGALENAPMVRQWVTDSIRLGDIQKFRDPESWKKSIFSLSKFYSQEAEVQAITRTIRDPNYYREGPLENGVAHVFMPETLSRDASWFNNKRLESHGLALMGFSDTIAAGISEPRASWGISQEAINTPAGQQLLQATRNLADYLLAVNTNPRTGAFDFKTPSAGN